MRKMLVVALDGATWNILEPMMNSGELPCLLGIREKGAWGPLRSVNPTFTIPAWKCYSTGLSPGALGVYFFLRFDARQDDFVLTSSLDFKFKEIWDYLGGAGAHCGIFNLPGTFPAKPVQGFMVSDYAINERGFFPRHLYHEVIRQVGDFSIGIPWATDRKKALDLCWVKTEREFSAIQYLVQKFGNELDWLQFTLDTTDGMQHYFWTSIEVAAFWKMVDFRIGKFIESVAKIWGNEFNILVVSDHGGQLLESRFNIGTWLVQKGYLELNLKGRLLRRIITKVPSGWSFKVFDLVSSRISRFGRSEVRLANYLLRGITDFNRSMVVAPTGTILYVNKRALPPEFVDQFKARLASELSTLVNPRSGRQAFGKIYVDLWKINDSSSPEIILPAGPVDLICNPLSDEAWVLPNGWVAGHHIDGIFIGSGPDISKGRVSASLLDIAPTILHMYNLPVPPAMEGRVLTEILTSRMTMDQKAKAADADKVMEE